MTGNSCNASFCSRYAGMKLLILICCLLFCYPVSAQTSSSPIIPEADGFFILPGAALQPDKNHIYKAVYNATAMPDSPEKILPALNMAGSELNALGVYGIPVSHAKFAIVFHGDAVYGILDNNHYKQKFGMDNPNLNVLNELKKNGVELFVCGQNLLSENIDLKTISIDVSIASDALIVLMTYQNNGYALMNY
jgi:intracellular sulfur oxidation DsrE/DsrF family protein